MRSLDHGICHVDATVLDGDDYVELSRLRSKPSKSGSRPLKADETTSYNKPVGNVITHADSAAKGLSPSSDDAPPSRPHVRTDADIEESLTYWHCREVRLAAIENFA